MLQSLHPERAPIVSTVRSTAYVASDTARGVLRMIGPDGYTVGAIDSDDPSALRDLARRLDELALEVEQLATAVHRDGEHAPAAPAGRRSS